MVTIRHEKITNVTIREQLLDAALGTSRCRKTSERLREGRISADGLAFAATDRGRLVGTVRLWNVAAESGQPALLLGPLAVAASHRGRGMGADLMDHALRAARDRDHQAIVLVGDPEYYGRFGFSADKTGALWMPGPYERRRLLALELVSGALDGAHGLIEARGRDRRPMTAAPHRRAA